MEDTNHILELPKSHTDVGTLCRSAAMATMLASLNTVERPNRLRVPPAGLN